MAIMMGTDWNETKLRGTGSIIDLTQSEIQLLGHGLELVAEKYCYLEEMYHAGHTADEIVVAADGLLRHGRTGQMADIMTLATAGDIDALGSVLGQISEAISALEDGAGHEVVTADSISAEDVGALDDHVI